MHDQRPPPHPRGSPSSPDHSAMMWEAVDRLSDLARVTGGLETGQRMTIAALEHLDEKITGGLETVHGRITGIETRIAAMPLAGPQPAASAATLSGIREVINAMRDLVTAVMPLRIAVIMACVTMLAVKGIVAPEIVHDWIASVLPTAARPAATAP